MSNYGFRLAEVSGWCWDAKAGCYKYHHRQCLLPPSKLSYMHWLHPWMGLQQSCSMVWHTFYVHLKMVGLTDHLKTSAWWMSHAPFCERTLAGCDIPAKHTTPRPLWFDIQAYKLEMWLGTRHIQVLACTMCTTPESTYYAQHQWSEGQISCLLFINDILLGWKKRTIMFLDGTADQLKYESAHC